jgi:NitT/TauT family transport system permease protein
MTYGNKSLRKTGSIAYAVFKKSIVIIVICAAWFIVPNYTESRYLPPLLEILKAWKELIEKGEYAKDFSASMSLWFIAVVLAVAASVPLGILLGKFKTFEEYIDPTLQIARNTSILALLPLFILLFGIGSVSKIAIIIFAAFPPTIINTIQGVKNVDPILIKSAQSMGVSKSRLLFKVVLPSATPYIFAGIRISAGIGLIVLVGAEMVGAQYGLGFMIFNYSHTYMIPEMYIGIISLAGIGILVNFILLKLEHRLTIWKEKVD